MLLYNRSIRLVLAAFLSLSLSWREKETLSRPMFTFDGDLFTGRAYSPCREDVRVRRRPQPATRRAQIPNKSIYLDSLRRAR